MSDIVVLFIFLTSLSANYFYYNLGYGGEGDGWYYAGNDFYTPAARFDNLKMIYNITPPTN